MKELGYFSSQTVFVTSVSKPPHLIISLPLQNLQLSRFLQETVADLLKCVAELYQPSLQGQNQL